ncbi:FAD dependent oxidoreductase [Obelidium mucronatum]|nr:FAD dependent oxidoreductase [Obelidium mucronatum]
MHWNQRINAFQAGGILYKHWRVHPANLTLAIAQKAISMGNVFFFPDCHVTAVHRRNSEDPSLPSSAAFTLETSLGLFTATSQIVYATNAWTSAILPSIQITPIRNQLVCTAPVPSNLKWKNGEFALMMNEGYEYASGRGDGRVVLGGMRYLSENMDVGCDRDDSLNSTVSEALRNYLPIHFEGFGRDSEFAIEHEWSGIMGWTEDKFPLCRSFGGNPRFRKGGIHYCWVLWSRNGALLPFR